jgi:hypothetical protein
MLDWLTADLAANELDWTIVFTHYPPYSKGSHNSDTLWHSQQLREHFLPVLEAGGVDLLLTGHSHGHERSYLLDGHYGDSSTFSPTHQVDDGDGYLYGDGVYHKPTAGPAPHEGAVYIVAGSSSRTAPGTYDHPAMFRSEQTLGSVALTIDGEGGDRVRSLQHEPAPDPGAAESVRTVHEPPVHDGTGRQLLRPGL